MTTVNREEAVLAKASTESPRRRQAVDAWIYVRALVRDRLAFSAALFLLILAVAAALAGTVMPFSPTAQDLLLRNRPPLTPATDAGLPHLLGTDALGRDVLTRLLYGARVSLAVGAMSVLVSGVFGIVLGLISGYYRGIVDDIVMRAADIQMAFPSLLLALLVLYALGPSIANVILVLAITRWTIYARVTRGMVLSQREQVFVEAARSIGCSNFRILFVHILPNMMAPILVLGTLETAVVILSEASLSFLGLGIQPPDSSWGLMLAEGRQYIRTAWWLVTFPGLAILLTALSLNLLATWFRGVTDPVQRWRFLRTSDDRME